MKETLHKRANTTRFHLYKILKHTKIIFGGEKPEWWLLLEREVGLSRKSMRKLSKMLVINLYLQMLELQRYFKESSFKIWVFHSMYILPKTKILDSSE